MVLANKYRPFIQSRNTAQRRLLFFTRLMALAEILVIVIVVALLLVNFAFGKTTDTLTTSANSQDSTDYFKTDFPRYENHVYVPNIKTVQFHPLTAGGEFSPPLISLHSHDLLQFSFDDLDGGVKSYQYRILHCTYDWKPSDLLESQYQTGFSNIEVGDARFSFNTIQQYTHYSFNFPGENLAPLISGNFLLVIFSDYNPEKIVITRRFMVVDQKVTVEANVHRATIISDRKSKQEVDFSIFYPDYTIDDPFSGLKVAIYQNDRTDQVISNLKPQFLKDHELMYDYDEGNEFDGGNEFRFFDTRSLRTPAEHTEKITRDSSGYHVYLVTDARRSSEIYSSGRDINGQFIIQTEEGKTRELESDYCRVHFSLNADEPYPNGNVYVFGSFTGWNCTSANKMHYDAASGKYEATLFLKQGFYNYEYVFVEDGLFSANEQEIEGNHSETENDYMICVYNRRSNSRYDELIGVKKLNSVLH
ncbi:MAG: DUF5103 domain-containing protein [Bacteroidetes bacterium]|nr:DUF5103 domain-containing protein [Bacteroidota bacterium]